MMLAEAAQFPHLTQEARVQQVNVWRRAIMGIVAVFSEVSNAAIRGEKIQGSGGKVFVINSIADLNETLKKVKF